MRLFGIIYNIVTNTKSIHFHSNGVDSPPSPLRTLHCYGIGAPPRPHRAQSSFLPTRTSFLLLVALRAPSLADAPHPKTSVRCMLYSTQDNTPPEMNFGTFFFVQNKGGTHGEKAGYGKNLVEFFPRDAALALSGLWRNPASKIHPRGCVVLSHVLFCGTALRGLPV